MLEGPSPSTMGTKPRRNSMNSGSSSSQQLDDAMPTFGWMLLLVLREDMAGYDSVSWRGSACVRIMSGEALAVRSAVHFDGWLWGALEMTHPHHNTGDWAGDSVSGSRITGHFATWDRLLTEMP